MDPAIMATGEPDLPDQFTWRGKPLCIASIIRKWEETGPCKNKRSEQYVRKHWFEVQTTDNQRALIYFERQPRSGKRNKRWWLFSIDE